jgi:hypothetical protein
MIDDSLSWLMQWYLGECDNDWEHTYGVEIGTLDNPGWSLKVDLKETTLEGRSFARVTHGQPAADLDEWRRTGSWWVADVKDSAFEASCGPLDLPEVISLFRKWAQSAPQG